MKYNNNKIKSNLRGFCTDLMNSQYVCQKYIQNRRGVHALTYVKQNHYIQELLFFYMGEIEMELNIVEYKKNCMVRGHIFVICICVSLYGFLYMPNPYAKLHQSFNSLEYSNSCSG